MTKTNTRTFYCVSILFAFVLCLDWGLGGSTRLVQEADAASATVTPTEGKALIVFLRPLTGTALFDSARSSLFEIKDDNPDPQLVGIGGGGTKIAYQTDPGRHLFMVVGETADFMAADVLPNSTYYVSVMASAGKWRVRYSLKVADKQEQKSKDFTEQLALSKWVENTAASQNWAASNMPSIRTRYAQNYPIWTSKEESERSSLLPDDRVGGQSQPSERAASGGTSVKKLASTSARDASESVKPAAKPLRPAAQLDGAPVLVADAEKSVIANPEDALAWRTLGDAHASSGEWAKAGRAYEEALRLAPNDSKSLTNLALTYCKRYDRNQLNNAVRGTRETNPSLSEQIVRRCILP